MPLPELQRLRTVRQLCEEYPRIFTEGSLRHLIFNGERNGFGRCIIRIGRRLYIDLEALQEWMAKHRDIPLEDSGISSPVTERATRGSIGREAHKPRRHTAPYP